MDCPNCQYHFSAPSRLDFLVSIRALIRALNLRIILSSEQHAQRHRLLNQWDDASVYMKTKALRKLIEA